MKKLSARTRFILLNVLAAIVVIFCIGFYVLSRLDNYTRHGFFIEVPGFYTMTINEAQEVAAHGQLRVEVVDSLYDENEKPGVVLEQYPPIGSKVKENRLIHLITNSRNPEKVIFPNLQNAAYRQTLQTLEAQGFIIRKIEYIPSEFKNLVLGFKQNGHEIQPGALLNKGSKIDIIIGSGEDGNWVVVPGLTGKTLEEAIDLIRKTYLNIGEIVTDGSIQNKKEQLNAIVYEQHPGKNSGVTAGTPISLHVTLKKDKISTLDSLVVEE